MNMQGFLHGVVLSALLWGLTCPLAAADDLGTQTVKERKSHWQAADGVERCLCLWCPAASEDCTSFHCSGLLVVVAKRRIHGDLERQKFVWSEIDKNRVANCMLLHAPDGTRRSSAVDVSLTVMPGQPMRVSGIALDEYNSSDEAKVTWQQWHGGLEECLRTGLERPSGPQQAGPMEVTLVVEIRPSSHVPMLPTIKKGRSRTKDGPRAPRRSGHRRTHRARRCRRFHHVGVLPRSRWESHCRRRRTSCSSIASVQAPAPERVGDECHSPHAP